MSRKGWGIVCGAVFSLFLLAWYGVAQMNLSALPEPGRMETAWARKVRDWYIRRAAEGPLPQAPANNRASVAAGSALFGMGCASCHGQDGRAPTPLGKSMYPRALDLRSPAVQKLTERQLFWVIQNGIRLSGMPGFGRLDTDKEIWELTFYVRSLGPAQKPNTR